MPKRVTNGWAHRRGIGPGLGTTETLKRWRAVGKVLRLFFDKLIIS